MAGAACSSGGVGVSGDDDVVVVLVSCEGASGLCLVFSGLYYTLGSWWIMAPCADTGQRVSLRPS